MTATFLSFSLDADAQYRGKKKKKKKKESTDKKSEYFDESTKTSNIIWFGLHTDLNRLGFGPSTLGGGFTGNSIALGFIPSAAYKINDKFSAGLKASIFYTGGRFNGGNFGSDLILNAWDFSLGAFSRYNFLRYCFVHAEVENAWESYTTGILNPDNSLELDRESNFHYYLGAGIGTRGSKLSFGGYLLYDFSLENNFGSTFNFGDIPISLRIGLRYRYF